VIRILRLSVIVALLAAIVPARAGLPGHLGGQSVAAGPVCSLSGVSCQYAYSVLHQVVAGATKAFMLYNKTTTATQDIGFVSGLADVASVLTFCGTVANCAYETIYDQTGNGCNVTQATPADMMTYQLSTTNGNLPIMINANPAYNGNTVGTFPALPNLYTEAGCSALTGDVAKSQIIVADNSLKSSCCGEVGLMEDAHVVVHLSMFATAYYEPVSTLLFGADTEDGGTNLYPITPPPPTVRGIGLIAYFGSGSEAIDYNGTNLFTGTLAEFPLVTQSRMNFGCSGDINSCGPYTVEDYIITSGGLDAGHRAAVYSNLNAFYSGL